MRISMQQIRNLMLVIIALVLAGFLVSTIPFGQQRVNQRMPVSVTTAPISTVNKPLRIERTGSAVHATRVPVYSEGAGRVSDVYVTAGQTVKAGQPLVKLEITGGGSEAVGTPGLQTTEGSAAEEIYENAQKEYNRFQKLYEIGGIARKQLEAAEARLQAAQAGMENQQGVVTPGSVVSGPVTIQAPIDGTITGSVVTSGSAISAGQELMALGSGQDVEVVLPLEQSELYLVQLGSPAVIKVADQQLAGQVSSIYPEVKDQQIAAFMAQIQLTQPPANVLTPGKSVTVSIVTGQEVAVVAVPSQALLREEAGQYSVYLAVEGKAISQQVTIGEVIGDLIEVTTAIPQDSRVITSNIDRLKNGDSITVSE